MEKPKCMSTSEPTVSSEEEMKKPKCILTSESTTIFQEQNKQANIFFSSLEESLLDINSKLKDKIKLLPLWETELGNGNRPNIYTLMFLPVYYDGINEVKAGLGIEYNFDATKGYPRIITGVRKRKYGENNFNEVTTILDNHARKLSNLLSEENKNSNASEVNEYLWFGAKVYSLENLKINTEETNTLLNTLITEIKEVVEEIKTQKCL